MRRVLLLHKWPDSFPSCAPIESQLSHSALILNHVYRRRKRVQTTNSIPKESTMTKKKGVSILAFSTQHTGEGINIQVIGPLPPNRDIQKKLTRLEIGFIFMYITYIEDAT